MISDSKKISAVGRKLDRLEADIKALKVEYERYFNGALPVPPETQRSSVERRLRALRGQHLRGTADRFRLKTLETRFNVLRELWQRRIRESEQAAQRAGAAPASRRAARFDPFAGVQLAAGDGSAAAETLYSELYRSSGRTRKVDFQTFQRYLDQQIGRLSAKTGCREVQFRIAAEGGELKLKAKPILPKGSGKGGSR